MSRLHLRKGLLCFMDRDSSVGIATRYGLDGPGIESRWRRDFPNLSRPALGPTHPPVQWVPGLSGVRRPGRGADHPPPSKHRGHERVELYLYSPSGPQWPVIWRALPYSALMIKLNDYRSVHKLFNRCLRFYALC